MGGWWRKKLNSVAFDQLFSRQIKHLPDVPLPTNELARLKALRGLNLLDTPPEARFDRITRTTAHVFDAPISFITLVDANRQWFKSCYGAAIEETERRVSFCAHAILQADVFVVTDLAKDDRFKDNPIVTTFPRLRFYAGAPIAAPDGSIVGTLCVLDNHPRAFSNADRDILRDLSGWAELEINQTKTSRALEERKKAATALAENARLLERRVEERTADLRQALDHAQELRELADRIVRIMSHQIRTPLNAVRWELDLMGSGQLGKLSAEQRALVRMISERNTETISRVHDLLETLDLEERQVAFSKDHIHLDRLLAAAIAPWEDKFAGKNITIKYSTRKMALPEVMGDAQKIQVVLDRLLSNAYHYTPEDGTVTLSTRVSDGTVRLQIRDSGMGIPTEEADRVFTRFFRSGHAYQANPDASGLSLYICKRYMDAMHGNIGFTSAEASGSTFWIELPVADASAVPKTDPSIFSHVKGATTKRR